ncbi:SOS response-associated peptidase [Lacibacter sp. H407]|uniref:SOS response-associated peptidase n=1 Tax=Lacibacter sp. H407 TaxID=3133423 RepID=UPI0030BB8AB6
MCNFYGTIVKRVEYIKLLQIEKQLGTAAAMNELQIMKDRFRYSNSVILRKATTDDVEAAAAHWEFIPPWIKSIDELKEKRKQGIPWLNSKGETLLESKMFREAALKRRCLVLATHFYEWRHYQPEDAKKETAYPYAIEVNNTDYFYMAGIWQPWTDKTTDETMDTFAIITTRANELMEVVHNKKKRMPTILPEALAYEWALGNLSEARITELACYQYPSEDMNAHTIAKDFKTAADPLAEVEYEELPALDLAL